MSDLQVNMLEHRIKITYICPSLAEYGSNMDMAVEKCITYLDIQVSARRSTVPDMDKTFVASRSNGPDMDLTFLYNGQLY